ncbi:MAG: nucleotidyltransferase substrate binding protein [Alphaproteobacteria bacterium]|jgi:nucleotidyltransferase substrate binding protein (TIGR01987 family)|nr:nucleotidyltransferase substrate binding protein [Alphaproteobacteria bacterium]
MQSQPPKETPRWRYRFDNYKRAFLLLREAIEEMDKRELTQLEKEGIIQRFEYTWELAWKVLKDYLEYKGIVLSTITPAAAIKAAFAANIIHNGEIWMRALDARNKMSHTYSFSAFEEIIKSIKSSYLVIFDDLYSSLLDDSLSQI